MTTLALSYQKVQENISEINWRAICFAGIFMCVVLSVFYVWQINDLARGAYLTTGYEKQIAQLTAENKNLEVSFAENSFLGQALEKIHALNFQKAAAGSIKYIQIPDNSVATIKR